MADKDTDVVDTAEDAVVDNEAEETTDDGGGDNASEQYPDEIINIATKMGWRPADEFGDKKKYIPPDEYILNSHVINETLKNTNERLRKDFNELKRVVHSMSDGYTKQLQRETEKIRKELIAERDAAVVEGDITKFKKVEKELNELEDEKQTIEPPAGEIPEFTAWREENPWFEVDEELTKFANEIATEYQELPLKKVLKLVDKEVAQYKKEKERHVDGRKSEPPAVAGKVGTKTTGGKKRYTIHDLSYEQRKIAEDFDKDGVISVEKYIESLAKDGLIGKK